MTEQRIIELGDYARNDYSQWGEDGILEKLLSLARIDKGYFVEFGAWDGIYHSNTYALYKKGWSGCYIEGDASRYRELGANVPDKKVSKFNLFVTLEGENSLNAILQRAEAPKSIDVLSIDIDSDDLAVWRSLTDYVPKVVIIEYNPTIPFDTLFENPLGRSWGNSALSLLRLGEDKGYMLASATPTNLIFLHRDVNRHIALPEYSLSRMQKKTRYFWGQDGTLLRSDGFSVHLDEVYFLPWGRNIGIQPFPRPLRAYVDRRSPFLSATKICYSWLTAFLLRPVSFLRFAWGVLRHRRR